MDILEFTDGTKNKGHFGSAAEYMDIMKIKSHKK